jgi:hypothetical protein
MDLKQSGLKDAEHSRHEVIVYKIGFRKRK